MTDLSETFKAMNDEKRERHANWHKNNTEILNKSGITFRIASKESYLFREENKPKVDFYPSTGRWRDLETGRTYNGMAHSFIAWYKKQNKKYDRRSFRNTRTKIKPEW